MTHTKTRLLTVAIACLLAVAPASGATGPMVSTDQVQSDAQTVTLRSTQSGAIAAANNSTGTAYYQVDFVAGDPMANLSADNLYAGQDRLLRYALGNADEGFTDRGTAWATQRVRSCVDAPHIRRNGDTANITFTVDENCSAVDLSLVSYEIPSAGFSLATVDQQTLFDSAGGTFDPGTHTLTVDLPPADDGGPTDGPANFTVSDLSAPEDVVEGDTVPVNATVTNAGGSEATQTVEFRIDLDGDGTPEASGLNESVTLAPGASTSVSFVVPTEGVSTGTYVHGVFTENDSATAEITIEEPDPAHFEVSDVDAPEQVERNESINVSAEVTNTGDLEGNQTIRFALNGSNVSTGSGALDVVLLIDDSGSMSDEISTVRSELTNFTNTLEAADANVEFTVITFADELVLQQEFTGDVEQVQDSIGAIAIGGGTEYNYDAINGSYALPGRPNAKRVIIDFTDEDSDVWSGTPTQDELAEKINETDTKYIAVAPNRTGTLEKKTLAAKSRNGAYFDIAEGNFSEKFQNEIAVEVANVSRQRGQPVDLDPGESETVSFRIDTTGLPPGEYVVAISSENETATTTVTVAE